MRDILVPLDGAGFGERAMATAVDLAQQSGATLHLVHVYDLSGLPYHGALFCDADPVWLQRWREDGRALLRRVASAWTAPRGIPTRLRLLEAPIAQSLAAYVVRSGIQLVVMSTHGRGGLTRTWMGSVADDLIRRVTVPILLVPPRVAVSGGSPSQHILLPLDGSSVAEAALAPATAMAAAARGRLTLLHVLLPMHALGARFGRATPGDVAAHARARERAERYLSALAARVAPTVPTVRTLVVTSARTADAITRRARTEGADVIALATRGRHGMSRWALGSVADEVIRSRRTAVLVVRPGAVANDPPHSRETVWAAANATCDA